MEQETYPVSGEWLWQWRKEAIAQAIAHDIPHSEVDWLLQALTQYLTRSLTRPFTRPLTRLDLRLETFRTCPTLQLSCSTTDLEALWLKRVEQRVPLQYLVGHTQWRQFQLTVSPAVLIPRPETELIIDWAIEATATCPVFRQGDWVDLGTGSGAIALGLAAAFPEATIHGVDCSDAALAIATTNIQRHRQDPQTPTRRSGQATGQSIDPSIISERIHLHRGSWFSPWEPDAQSISASKTVASPLNFQFSGIVSNPPYIPSEIVLTLQPEVTLHEPHLALDGGADGLECLRYLINRASTYLKPNGILLMEMMAGQAQTVANLIDHQGDYHSTEIYPDLAGIDRFVLTRRKPDKLLDI